MSVNTRLVLAFVVGMTLGIGGTISLTSRFSGTSSPREATGADFPPTPPKMASSSTAARLSATGPIADAAKVALPAPGSEAFAELIRGLLTDGNENRRVARFQLLLEKFSPEHFRAMLPLIRENDLKGAGSPKEWTALWQFWGAAFPQEALAAMQSLDSSEWGPGAQEEAQKRVLRGWAEAHPQEAIAFYESQAPEFWMQPDGALEAVLKGWMATDPEGAATWLLTSNNYRSDHVKGVMEEMARKGGTAAVEDWFERQRGSMTPKTIGRFASGLIEQKLRLGAEVAKEWIDQHQEVPWKEANSAVTSVSGQLATKNPLAAVEWAISLDHAPGALSAITVWCSQDIGAASQWLRDHSNLPFYDSAAYALVANIIDDDPATAQAWIDTIKDESLKTELQEALTSSNADDP